MLLEAAHEDRDGFGMTSNLVIRALDSEQWQLLRTVRLRALSESPEAFSKTAAEEAAYDESEWRRRLGVARASPPTRWLIAEDAGRPVGLACGRIDPERPDVANVFSMWVAPSSRRSGIGKRLVQAIVDWARAVGARRLVLGVAAGSKRAVQLYESTGFVRSDGAGPAGQPAPPADGSFVVMTLELARGSGATPMAGIDVAGESPLANRGQVNGNADCSPSGRR
jgi:GNAT superfamily N-acetyltransferase